MTTFTTEDRLNSMLDLEPIPFAGMVDLGEPTMTQEAVAKELGVSRTTVCNIERSAYKKLRRALFKLGFTKEDLL
jgi:predicted DNA-binding protein (UPF0251 family)